MKIMGLLIGLLALLFLIYALAGDYIGVQKGDGKKRALNQVQVTEDVAKRVGQSLNSQEKQIEKNMAK